MAHPYAPRPAWRAAPAALDRRAALAGLAAVFTAVPSLGLAQPSRSCPLTPDAGEGPFYFDPALVRSDITDGLPGAPLELALRIVRVGDCATLEGARVDLWHADAIGLYSGYERQPGTGEPSRSVAGKTFLRGTQFTDAQGRVVFATLFPSWYGGRTPHVHFKVFLGGDQVVASQVFFPEEVNEEVFRQWEPYRERRSRRTTFNANDRFLRDSVDGVFCAVEREPHGYRAAAVVAIRA